MSTMWDVLSCTFVHTVDTSSIVIVSQTTSNGFALYSCTALCNMGWRIVQVLSLMCVFSVVLCVMMMIAWQFLLDYGQVYPAHILHSNSIVSFMLKYVIFFLLFVIWTLVQQHL